MSWGLVVVLVAAVAYLVASLSLTPHVTRVHLVRVRHDGATFADDWAGA